MSSKVVTRGYFQVKIIKCLLFCQCLGLKKKKKFILKKGHYIGKETKIFY